MELMYFEYSLLRSLFRHALGLHARRPQPGLLNFFCHSSGSSSDLQIEPAMDFTALYRRLRPRLLRILNRDGRRSDAEDIVQDAFARLLILHEMGGVVSPNHAWNLLKEIAQGMAIDQLRRAKTAEFALESLARRPTVQREPQSSAAIRAVFDATVAELPARQRESMRLRYVEGLKIEEIAQRLGVARRTTLRDLKLGARRMQAEFRAAGYEPDSEGEFHERR